MFVPILAYHKIQNAVELGVSFTTLPQFERQIEYLSRHNFTTISLHDYVLNRNIGEKSVVITFDDAYTSVYSNAFPILERHGYTATVFAITRFVGQLNSWDYHLRRFWASHCDWPQLKRLQEAGWEIGSHTVSHRNLRRLSSKQLWYQLRYSKDILEQKLGAGIASVSYPFGAFDRNVLTAVRAAGYDAACTLGYNFPYNQSFPFALARRGVYCFEPMAWFRAKLANNYLAHCDDIRQKIFSAFSRNSTLLRSQDPTSKIT